MLKAVCINETEQDRTRQLRDAFRSFPSLSALGPARSCTLRMGEIILREQHKTAGQQSEAECGCSYRVDFLCEATIYVRMDP